MTTRAIARPCRVAGCTRMGRLVGRRATSRDVCSMHEMRKRRYGSFTARRCWACARIVDDDGTSKVGGSFFCERCLATRTLCSADGCERVVHYGSDCCNVHARPKTPRGRRGLAARQTREVRRCAAYGCRCVLGRERLAFCVRHWTLLSPAIKDRVHAAHYGETDAEWLDAVTDAKEWIRGGA